MMDAMDHDVLKSKLKIACNSMNSCIESLKIENDDLFEEFSYQLANSKQIQEDLIFTLTRKLDDSGNETYDKIDGERYNELSPSELINVLTKLSIDPEDTVQGLGSELDEDNCFNKLFEVSYSRSSFSVDDERNSFLVLLEAEQLKGNKRLNKVVGSFEKVRIAQRKLINEKVCQMRFDLGQSDLERTIATNAVTIQTLRDQLSELTQRAEEKRSNEPDYAEMQDSKLRQMNDTVEGARKAAGILETDIIRVQAQMERNRVAISRLVHELQLDRRSTDGDLEEEEEEEQMAKFSSPSTPRTDGSTSQKPNSPRKTAIGLSKGSAAKEATEEDAEGLELAASTTRANRTS
mmetsp:Transcript_27825/g.39517  ORF Transcript_27825/g.39517 Transcript_27825/m.39517 type:complete len:349 (-) Transcript_27825:5-1051(-)